MSEAGNQETAPKPSMLGAIGPELLADPYRVYRMLNSMSPVLWMDGLFGLGGWIITDHAACSSGLRSKHFIKEGYRVLSPEKLALIPQEGASELAERRRSNMLFRDPPDHTRLRGLVSQAFTPRMVERLRPHVAEIARDLVDQAVAKKSFDLIREVAFPLPIIVIAELLGVPAADRDRFKSWSTDTTALLHPDASAEDIARGQRAIDSMDAYMQGVIDERRKDPQSDLISGMIRVQEAGDKLSDQELIATCRLLLNAGHETTVNLIGNGTLALLRHPEQRAMLAADLSLLPNAVEELLRYDSPVQMTFRFAFEDTPLGQHTAKRGDVAVFLLGGANRDPRQFTDPDRLDLRRENAHTHLSFGSGIHYCLGAPLARLEGELVFGELLRRAPNLSLATTGELAYRHHVVLRGLKELPVQA
jgi:cytochrome P450